MSNAAEFAGATKPHPLSGSSGDAAPLRLAILQRVCTPYRLALFQRLSQWPTLCVRVFIGEDVPHSKVRNATDLSGIDALQLPTCFLRLPGRVIPIPRGLTGALEQFQPDVILTEGESHPMGCLAAIRYRQRHAAVRLAHWSLGGMPGVEVRPKSLRSRVKRWIQDHFDVLISYSSFGKDCLIALGHPPEKIRVATNVSHTEEHLQHAESIRQSQAEARRLLGLPDRFTVLYAGAMDPNKRLDILLAAVAASKVDGCNAVLLGRGGMMEQLKATARQQGLDNVFFPGHVGEELALYYRASNVLVLPGRGGMVISEAMAHGLPVIAFQADGTELDLIQDGQTGILLKHGDAGDLRQAIESLQNHLPEAAAMGMRGQAAIRKHFLLENLAESIVAAVGGACEGPPASRTHHRPGGAGYGRAA